MRTGASGDAAVSRWRPHGRVWLILAAAVAVVLVAGGTVLLVHGGGNSPDTVALSTPRYRSDPLAQAKPLADKDIAKHCGVSRATRHTVVPDADKMGKCEWYSLQRGSDGASVHCQLCPSAGGDVKRHLSVSVDASKGNDVTSPIGAAMIDIHQQREQAAVGPVPYRTVTGLGEEAIARYVPSSDGGASVVFRYRNVVVSIGYDGDTTVGKDRRQVPLPKKAALRAALRVATDVAGALGGQVPAKPAFGTLPAGAHALTTVPKTCDAVPRPVVDTLTPDADRTGQTTYRALGAVQALQTVWSIRMVAAHTCTWHSEPSCCTDGDTDHGPTRTLTVTMWATPDDRPGGATRAATRVYRVLHSDARGQHHRFHLLTGPGDEAFEEYLPADGGEDDPTAQVVLRVRNVLAVVQYSGDDDGPSIPRSRAIDGAYTAATAVARSLAT